MQNYMMCKIHASTTFHSFVFSPKSQPSRMQIFTKTSTWKPPQVLYMSYMMYFYYKDCFYVYLSKHRWNTLLFTQQTPRWQPPGQPCLAIAFSQPLYYRIIINMHTKSFQLHCSLLQYDTKSDWRTLQCSWKLFLTHFVSLFIIQ